jgi:glucoamylase
MASDCNVELHKNVGLISRFETPATAMLSSAAKSPAVARIRRLPSRSAMACDAATALAAAEGSLAAGFPDREAAYRKDWSDCVDGLRTAPSSVSSDTLRRRVYDTAAMALHAAEDKTFRGGNVAGSGAPWAISSIGTSRTTATIGFEAVTSTSRRWG